MPTLWFASVCAAAASLPGLFFAIKSPSSYAEPQPTLAHRAERAGDGPNRWLIVGQEVGEVAHHGVDARSTARP